MKAAHMLAFEAGPRVLFLRLNPSFAELKSTRVPRRHNTLQKDSPLRLNIVSRGRG
jgi:hypothetical protein